MIAHELDNDGVVINTIVVDSLPIPGRNLIEATEGGIGWHWDGETLTPPASPPLPVPQSLTYRQFILGLLEISFITEQEAVDAAARVIPAAIDAIFDTLPSSDATKARVTFKTMVTIERVNPLVSSIGTAIGKTEEELNDFFRLAGAL